MSKSYQISFSTKHQGFASFIPGIYTSLSGTNASTVDWELKRSRVMYLMGMQLLEQPFLNGLFLKGLLCSQWQGGHQHQDLHMQIAGGTCLPAPGAWWLQCHTLGQALWASITGGSAIRRYSPYLPYHAIPFVSPETWMISWEVFHIVSQSLPCFLRSNLLNYPKLMCSPGGSPFVACPAKQVHPA